MAILGLLLAVAAATMLLLFAVSNAQKGIKAYATVTIRRVFVGRGSRLRSTLAGLGAAVLLQSSAAVALLTSTFIASGLVGFAPALAAVLGADLGSALVVLLLSFRVDGVLWVCLALGGWLYLKSGSGGARQIGQVILGVGLVLLSLRLLSDAFEPLRESTLWPTAMSYLASDLVTAFLVGAALAFVIHSSVAAILMIVTLADAGSIPVDVAIVLTLGANLGSSLIPVWLTRGMAVSVRRVMWGNVAVRGTAAVMALCCVLFVWSVPTDQISAPGQTILMAHVLFNAALLAIIPIITPLGAFLASLMPAPETAQDAIDQWRSESCLTPMSPAQPGAGVANIRRETQRMANLVGSMAQPALGYLQSSQTPERDRIRRMNAALQNALDSLRTYASEIETDDLSKSDRRALRDLTDVAIDLTAAGHIVADRMMGFADTVQIDRIAFSPEGWAELQHLNTKVLENMGLVFGALTQNDTALARIAVEAKTDIRKLERRSRKQHLKRLRDGTALSFESSDIHLDSLRALKDMNSKLTETVYPMLSRDGQLSETRLIPN